MKRKKLGKKIATIATVSALTVSCFPMGVFAAGSQNVDVNDKETGNTAFRTNTDNNAEYKEWKENIWDAGAKADSSLIALTPGATESDLNFAWYSQLQGKPAVKVWKVGDENNAKVFEGTAKTINATNVQGSKYAATNHVDIKGYFEADTEYRYQYTDNYTGEATVWKVTHDYKTADTKNFSVILTGDPQVGASGGSGEGTADDLDIARDTYNWNLTVEQAVKYFPEAAFLLSVGDQVDRADVSETGAKVRESEYAGYLYPEEFRSLPIAATIGNHDTQGADYSYHFNNPNSEGNLGATAAGSDFYFSYGDVLIICLNSNNRNQTEHRELMQEAVESNPDATWKIAYFHSDIYGAGSAHADTDAAGNRIVFAPLMDEFDIDLCFTGHDHTYSRSYQVLDGNVIDYDISGGSVTNPEGTMYISTGSGSGSKYYNFLNYVPYYIADMSNTCLPAFSALEFTEDGKLSSVKISTFDYNGDEYAETFTINKTDAEASAEDVIAQANAKLADRTTAEKYTKESVAALEKAVADLEKLQASYTTAEDPMEEILDKYYNTADDRCTATGVTRADGTVDGLGYGHVRYNEDKDAVTKADGSVSYTNRFKKGLSTLIDKTIYTQLENGVEKADLSELPIVDAKELETAKAAVLTAMASLEEPKKEETATGKQDETTGGQEETSSKNEADSNEQESGDGKAPQTGDSSDAWIYVAGMLVAAGVGLTMFRKKEEDCETR